MTKPTKPTKPARSAGRQAQRHDRDKQNEGAEPGAVFGEVATIERDRSNNARPVASATERHADLFTFETNALRLWALTPAHASPVSSSRSLRTGSV
jgi:hypothetical protein